MYFRDSCIALLKLLPSSGNYLVKSCARCQGTVTELNELHEKVLNLSSLLLQLAYFNASACKHYHRKELVTLEFQLPEYKKIHIQHQTNKPNNVQWSQSKISYLNSKGRTRTLHSYAHRYCSVALIFWWSYFGSYLLNGYRETNIWSYNKN